MARSGFISRHRYVMAAFLALAAGVVVTNAAGAANTVPSVFVGVDPPVRILDTRPAPDGPVGLTTAQPVAGGSEVALTVAGLNGVPANATAVVLNVTAVGATALSFVTVYPGPGNRPIVSTLNPAPGQISFNSATVAIGTDGRIRFFNNTGSVNLIADLVGYYVPAGGAPPAPVGPNLVVASNDAVVDAPTTIQSQSPSMTATIQVTAGQRLLLEWSGEALCASDLGSATDQCVVGFTLDGVVLGDPVRLKNLDLLAESSWSVRSIQRASAALTAGSHTVTVTFADPPGAGGVLSLDSQVLSVIAF